MDHAPPIDLTPLRQALAQAVAGFVPEARRLLQALERGLG
jgi:hypothetical protein